MVLGLWVKMQEYVVHVLIDDLKVTRWLFCDTVYVWVRNL
jgi:hypothetical protein